LLGALIISLEPATSPRKLTLETASIMELPPFNTLNIKND